LEPVILMPVCCSFKSRVWWVLALVMAMALFAQPTLAGGERYTSDKEYDEAGGWTISVNQSRKSCVMYTFFEDDTVIEVGVDRSDSTSFFLMFGNKKWKYRDGHGYEVVVVYDGRKNWQGNGVGVTVNDIHGVAIEDVVGEVVDDFAARSRLALEIDGHSYGRFNLRGTRAGLNRLIDCVNDVNHGRVALDEEEDNQDQPNPPKTDDDAPVDDSGTGDGKDGSATDRQETIYSTGTGFFINADGYLLTNAHVVEGCDEAFVRVPDGREAEAAILSREKQNDLAILKADLKPGATAKFRGSPQIRLGESVVLFGYPLTDMLSSTGNLSTGLVSALAGAGDDVTKLQISAPVQSGNSGGSVVDQTGHVVGIVVAKADTRNRDGKSDVEVLQNVNFAIKSGVAQFFLDAQQVSYAVEPPTQDLPVPDLAALAKSFSAQVVCQLKNSE
jgi:S1-C subfamily serine protease